MENFVWGVASGIVVAVIGCILCCKFCCRKCVCEAPASSEDEAKKAENLKRAMEFIDRAGRFTNDDLQAHLKVSNTTVGRYLQDMERAGTIQQVGNTGKNVYYTKK